VNNPLRQEVAPIVLSLLGIALVGFVLILLHLSAPFLNPILLAFFITSLATPGFRWLRGRGLPSGAALVAMVVIIVLAVVVLGGLAWLSASRLQAGLSQYADDMAARLNAAAGQPPMSALSGVLITVADGDAMSQVMSVFLRSILEVVGTLVFSIVLVAFFLLESTRFGGLLMSSGWSEHPIIANIPVIARTAARYFGIRTGLNLMTGAGIAAFLLLLGVDYALLWGVVAFVLSYIPYIGITLALIPPTLLAFAEFGIGRAVVVILAALVVNVVIENVVEPSFTGRQLQLSPTVVFVSFFFWGWLLGPVGILMSMPITVMLMHILDSHPQTRWAASIIRREPLARANAQLNENTAATSVT
jgi:AI-2 transport protein TqsA